MPALSSDVLVNTQTNMEQTPQGVAALSGGTAVASWIDYANGAQGLYDAKFRLIGADGQPIGLEIKVGQAFDIGVAGLTGGGFVAVWSTKDGGNLVVKAQVYSAAGVAQGEAQTLSTTSDGGGFLIGLNAQNIEVVGLSDGGYAATWSQTHGDSGGSSSINIGFAVGSATGALERYTGIGVDYGKAPMSSPQPDVVELPGGKVLLSWADAEGGFPYSVARYFQSGQVFDLSGQAQGQAFEFPATANGGFHAQSGLQMAALPSGDVAFVWKTAAGEVWMSLYNGTALASGNTATHSAPQLVTSTLGSGEAQIAVLPDGRFIVAYSSGPDPMAQVYSAAGVADGAAFKLGTSTADTQDIPDIALLPNGSLIGIWRDWSGTGGDPSSTAVKAGLFMPGDGLQGTEAGDALTTGAGNQVLAGLEGADTLNGGTGADTLIGGAGADRFVFTVDGQQDRVLDFSHAQGDQIDLRTAAGGQASSGLFIVDQVTGQAWWDPDSDAGALAPVALGRLNVMSLVRGDFANEFRPDGVRVLTWNGGREDTVFDWSTQKTFATATFNARGAAEMWHVEYDDGRNGTRWWDTDGTQAFSTRAADYDGQGQLLAYGVTYDDGHSQVFQFDVNNTKAWSRLVDMYDALGRQSMQGVVWDDGTAAELHRDTYDVYGWAYYIDNYKDGALLNHTFYNADGSVFVG